MKIIYNKLGGIYYEKAQNSPPPFEPSRGTNVSDRRTIINGNRVFRFDCERCCLLRGAVVAFTLAEALITLGIIGIVAALTIPNLITNHKSQVLQSQFKKTYNELSQINQKFIYDYGMNMCEYDWMLVESGMTVTNASKEFAKKFGEYFVTKNKNIGWEKIIANVKTLTGSSVNLVMFDDGYNYDFMKRTYFFEYGSPTGKCPVISVDINGISKKPNQLGIDIFSFRPTLDGRIIPVGNPNNVSDNKNGNQSNLIICSQTDNSNMNGFGCAFWASIDKHPQDNTKSYWKDFIK